MIVPTIERQVKEQPQMLETPSVSGAVPGAFGEQVAEAQGNIGKAVGGVAGMGAALVAHMQKQEVKRREDQGKDAANKLLNYSQQLLYGNSDVEFTDSTGQKRTRKFGELNNLSSNADGATSRYEQQFAVADMGYQQAFEKDRIALKKYMELRDSIYHTHSKSVLSHEAQEVRRYSTELSQSVINNLENKALLDKDPEALTLTVDNIAKESQSLGTNLGLPAEKVNEIASQSILKAVKNSVLGVLESTGNEAQAGMLLAGMQGKIPDQVYAQVKQDLVDKSAQIQNAYKRQQTENIVATRMQVYNDLIKGDMSSVEDEGKLMALSRIDPDGLGIALQRVKKSRMGGDKEWFGFGKEKPYEYGKYKIQGQGETALIAQDMQALGKQLMATSSQEEMSDFMMKVISDPKIGIEQLTALGDIAAMVGSIKKATKDSPDKPQTSHDIEMHSALTSLLSNENTGASTNNLLQNYIIESKKGASPKEAHDKSVHTENMRLNPDIIKVSPKGQLYRDAKGNYAIVYPDRPPEEVANVKGKGGVGKAPDNFYKEKSSGV